MRLLLAFLFLASPVLAAEPLTLDCVVAGDPAYRLELDSPEKAGALACVTRLGVAEPLPACAPNGGWLAAGPDGTPDLRTTDPRDLTSEGSILFARRGPSEFAASLGMGPGAPLALEIAGRTVWRMRLDLGSGEGVVETRDGELPMLCRPA